MRMCVGPKNVGQDDGIACIRFGSTGPVPIAIAGNSEWIDGVHLPTACQQCRNQEQARALDRDWNRLVRAIATLSKHAQEIGEPGGTDADPPFRQHVASFIDDSNVVVAFGPIDPTRQTHVISPFCIAH
jgi:hypothetical protein